MTTKKILFQIYSDIHIELWNKLPELPIKSKYLILAGDICQINHPLFYKFLNYCSINWEKTFYVPGNHEYYSSYKNMEEYEFEYNYHIKDKYKNIYYLNNSFTSLDNDINIYGTTFWTIPPFNRTNEAKIYLNDYNKISYYKKDLNQVVNLDVLKVKELSNNSFTKLQDYLNKETKKTIVITHFPPTRSGTSAPYYLSQQRIANLYFAWPDDTLEKFNLNNVPAWISGHTHWSYDFEQNGIRLIGNQLGYKSEIGKTRLNEDGVYEINVEHREK